MPRRARLMMAGMPQHVIQRGNNRSVCFYADEDYRYYLDKISEISKKAEVDIHAYVLMTNHVHLLMTPKHADGISRVMKNLGQRYVQYINKTYRRSGTLWEGRYRSSIVDADNYLLICQRYIELNPVRANMVEHPGEYKWSSYAANAQGKNDHTLSAHAVYQALSKNEIHRQKNYRELFRYHLEPGMIDEIRSAVNGGYCLGHERFQLQIEKALKRRVVRGKPGRPAQHVSEVDDQPELEL